MSKFPKPQKAMMVHEDDRVFVCMAAQPFAKAHTLVVWKQDVADLHALSCDEYDHLMRIVDVTRDALLKTFRTDKVYLFYMDEYRHVHWHLLPRFGKKGFSIVQHPPKRNIAGSVIADIRRNFERALAAHPEARIRPRSRGDRQRR